MQRRIVGSYQESKDVVSEVERLMNEGYVGEEILIITDSKSNHQGELEDLSLVEVDAVDTGEEMSFWEKTKEVLSFGNYDSDEPKKILAEYGVDETQAQPYQDSLRDGNILLLVNSDAPAQLKQQSEQGTDTAVDASKDTMKEDYEPTPGDEEEFDPSKAQSSREDKPTQDEKAEIKKNESDSAPTVHEDGDITTDSAETQRKMEEEVESGNNENRLDDQDAPQLTGDETTVTHVEGTHEYPDNINSGPVNPASDVSLGEDEDKKRP